MNRTYTILGLIVVAAITYWFAADCSLLTPDQQGYRLYQAGEIETASETFRDPMWQGVCEFRQGNFDEAAAIFSGYDTPEAAFNHGNSLLMRGRYEDAIPRYDRALELRPDWEPAIVNRNIAIARAKLLEQEGGEGTGGKLGADEIVFSNKKGGDDGGQEETDGGEPPSDEELRSVWLRQVQTRPADFLRAKFAYQHAMREAAPEGDG